MTRFLLVRHGQTEWNAQGRFMGQLDIPLNATGHAQAVALAGRLKDEQVNLIYTSDLSRARDTANAIRSSLASHVDLRLDARLRENNFGNWQGLTYSEIQERDPQSLALWEKDQLNNAPPNGETVREFHERVASFYHEVCEQPKDETVLVVAHGGSLQLLIIHALGLTPDRYWQFHLSNASLSDLRTYDMGAILNLLNGTSHLKGIK